MTDLSRLRGYGAIDCRAAARRRAVFRNYEWRGDKRQYRPVWEGSIAAFIGVDSRDSRATEFFPLNWESVITPGLHALWDRVVIAVPSAFELPS